MSPKTTSAALAAILLLAAAPAMAQDAPASAETPAPAAEAPAEAATDAAPAADAAAADASADAPADSAAPAEAAAPDAAAAGDAATEPPGPDEAQVGSYYLRSSFDSWMLRCIKTENDADPCELYQLMKDGEGNSVAEMTLIPLENGKAVAGATVVAPLETDLTKGIALRVDSGEGRAYPFNFCAPVGCVSRLGFTAEELNAMKRGKAATISLLPYGAPDSEVVNLNLSLAGFTAAYADLEKAVDEMRENGGEAAAPAEAPAAADAPAAQ
ncbi:invasion associated locus B family protein [Paracoccus jeotgali]|uniref:invasion associated locus B family protein n=1 Tax=Paracoccus jeotgali TaxID=2065379 RepID=UPI0028A673E5|nr:invasion associated locus B family protein [Paracoccus jeotgali]